MATKYFVLTNPSIGRTYHWNDNNNWSTVSGGTGGAGIPSSSDDVIIDSGSVDHGDPINNIIFIDNYSYCRNLTISPGFGFKIIWSETFYSLSIYGTLNLIGVPSGEVTLNFANVSLLNFYLYGTCGSIEHVIANKINSDDSSTSKRIIYNPLTCTVSNCIYWIDHAPSTIHIKTPTELQNINNDLLSNYILDNDLDMTSFTFTPIGQSSSFEGSFNGQGFNINNLTISGVTGDYQGLFGKTSRSSSISNINVLNAAVNVTGYNYIGILGGSIGGPVSKCSSTGSINAPTSSTVGGLIGYISDSITNCFSRASVIGDDTVAGLVGNFGPFSRQVLNSYSSGNVTANFKSAGFIGAYNTGSDIENCYSVGIVTINAYTPWVTSHSYVYGDKVSHGGDNYFCLTDHTSGVFATDLADFKWLASHNGGFLSYGYFPD